jgi:hypothetical protein
MQIITFLICVLMIVTTFPTHSSAEPPRSVQQLTPRNNGESIISNLPPLDDNRKNYFDSLIDQNGNIVFFYELGETTGFCTGRYNISTGYWETLTPTGWSANADAIPQPIGGEFFTTAGLCFGKPSYRFLRLTDTSNDIFAVVSGTGKFGVLGYDEHGNPFNYILQGATWFNRFAGSTATTQERHTVVDTYRWSAGFDFDTNGRGQGLIVAPGVLNSDSGPKGFYPARYDQDRGALNKNIFWVNWRNSNGNIGWNTSGAYQRVFTGLPWVSERILKVGYAGPSSLGSDVYLMNADHAVFRYDDGNQTWYIWNNNRWEHDQGQSTYQEVFSSQYYGQMNDYGDILRCGNEVVLFQSDYETIGGYYRNIHIRYVKTDGSTNYNIITPDATVPGIPTLSFKQMSTFWTTKPYTILNDPAGHIVIYYLVDNATTQCGELFRVTYDGQWNTPEGPFYTSVFPANETSFLNVIYPKPEQGSSPLVFMWENNTLLCLGNANEPLWSNEHPVVFTDGIPPLTDIDPSLFLWEYGFVNQAINTNENYQMSDDDTAWFLATDADGYLYALQTFSYPITIFPPGTDTGDNSVFWGHDWSDGIGFPGPLVVDNTRQRIFFLDQLDSQSGTLNARIRWLNLSYRTQFIYRYGGTYTFPENGGNIWYNVVAVKTPLGMVIDEPSGLLYTSSAITGEIRKFNISFTSQNHPIDKGVFISGLSGPTSIARDENGRFYIVESTKHRVSIFEPDGTYIESFGTFGRGPGQFCYPTQITYTQDYGLFYVGDPQNHRIQVFDSNHEFLTQWSTWPNNCSHNFSQLGGITAKGQFLYVSTYNSYPHPINFSSYKGYIQRFKIHDEPPTNVQIISPQNNANVISPIQVTFSTQDDWGIAKVELLVNGQVVANTSYLRLKNISDVLYWAHEQSGHGSHTWDDQMENTIRSKPLPERFGRHILAVRITDLQGQITLSENITVYILMHIPLKKPLKIDSPDIAYVDPQR